MAVWNPENALDAFRVSNAYLDMRLAPEAGCWIERFALGEDSANGVEGLFAGFLSRLMEKVNHHAIELAVEKILAA